MKKLSLLILFVVAASMTFVVFAQASMSSWPFFVTVTPRSAEPGTYEFVVPLPVLDKARKDLADLRLHDVNGREIPYALRIRKAVDERREIAARLFNQATVASKTSEVSVDLGDNPGEHNAIEIETVGTNFRRGVAIDGSDTGKEWRTLKTGDVIFSFESENKTVESNRVSYPTSRYRYLRVRLAADELTDREAPDITGVKVIMAVREEGELMTWNVAVPPVEFRRKQGTPTSAWTINFGGRVPCDRLTIDVGEESFSRPFQIEAVDDPQNIRLVASGELTRRLGEKRQSLVITFNQEEYVQKLRLLVSDYSNQVLSMTSIQAGAPARQVVFELKEAPVQPLRLFFGNAKATAPHYDFEKELPAKLAKALVHAEVGANTPNPDYEAEPLPFTERLPWLIYVVLAASSLALAMILISLARTTLRTEPQQTE